MLKRVWVSFLIFKHYNIICNRCSLDDHAEYSSTTNHINFDENTNHSKESETEDRSLVTSLGKTKPAFDSELDNIWNLVNSPYTDLNKLVDDVICSAPLEPITPITDALDIMKKNDNKRMRKSVYQVKILKQEFKRNSTWTKEDMLEVGKMSGLTHYQVYKWYWEQQKKLGDMPKSW